jgi:RNA polymerase sigma factor (sigma-70 family)
MTTVPALWSRHRRIAYALARDYHIPGMDQDDVNQEALVALWEAARCYDSSKGPFPAFAHLVVERRLTDALKKAKRRKRSEPRGIKQSVYDIPDKPRDESLPGVLEAFQSLPPKQRQAIEDELNERPRRCNKNTLWAARRKLRAAA